MLGEYHGFTQTQNRKQEKETSRQEAQVMSTKGRSRANENRAIRQEALRESLSKGKHIQHVIEICEELNDLTVDMDALAIQRKRAVIDTKMKLINKYLPDLKNVELSGGDTAIKIDNKWIVEVVTPKDE